MPDLTRLHALYCDTCDCAFEEYLGALADRVLVAVQRWPCRACGARYRYLLTATVEWPVDFTAQSA